MKLGQRPDRQRVRRGEAFLHTPHRQVSGQGDLSAPARVLGRAGGCVRPPAPNCPRSSTRPARLDACQQPVVGVQAEHADSVGCQLLAVQLDVAGMDDGDTLRRQRPVRLPQPKLSTVHCQRPAAASQVGVFQPFGAREHDGGKRAADGNRGSTEQQCAEGRCGEELPRRHAGGARHDQFRRSGQPPEAQDAAKQHANGRICIAR